jgi:hypothetical protein
LHDEDATNRPRSIVSPHRAHAGVAVFPRPAPPKESAMARPVFRGACFVFVAAILASFCEPAHTRPIRLHVFNLNPDHSYQVSVNGAAAAAPYSGAAGAVAVAIDAAVGDRVTFVDDGNPDLQPPAPPVFQTLVSSGSGCASASWIPSGDPTVVGYVVSAGRHPSQYDQTVQVGATSNAEVCLLPAGTHYFTVQCRNYAGMLSAYAPERSVEIVVVAVLIAQFDARVVDEGVALSWSIVTDEGILGFRVYRTGPDGVVRPLTPGLLDAGATSFIDRGARPGSEYAYFIGAVSESGEETRSVTVPVAVPALALALGQNLPNPFNPATTIPFVLEATSRVLLRVYDVRGALVATLHDGVLEAGRHAIGWDGRNDRGRAVTSGTYFYTLAAGKQRLARKMMVVR